MVMREYNGCILFGCLEVGNNLSSYWIVFSINSVWLFVNTCLICPRNARRDDAWEREQL